MDDIQVNPGIEQGHSTDIYERSNLTRLQLLYWTGHKLRPGTPIFNTIPTFIISGKVDRAHFERAFAALLQHNDALRTVIREIDGVPQREIVSSFPHPVLEHVDLSAEPDPEAALQSWLQKRCVVPLDLEVCLFDSALIKTASERYVWYLNQDHMITDASSAFLLFERLARLYELSLQGRPLEISGLPTFENYAEYERKYRNSPQAARAQAYWKEKLSPGPEAITFYGEVPAQRSTQVQRVTYDLGVERSQRVRAVAKREDIFMISEDLSLYNIFAALFFIQLHQASGNRRLGFVTPVHNRFTQVFRNTVGLLLELSPFQVEISEGETFISLVKKVKRETRETMTYYQYGSGLSLPKESFDIMFNMYQTPVLELDGMPVQFERVHPRHGSESLALHVSDLGTSRGLLLNFDIHRDVFTEEQQAQMVQDYVQLVDAFLEDDKQPLPALETVPGGDGLTGSDPESADRPAIADQSVARTEQSRVIVPPRNLVEHQLVRIWEEILELKPIGVKDDFFDLGGTSWLATRLFLQIESVMKKNLPLSTLLEARTVEEMAGIIQAGSEEDLWQSVVALQPDGNKPPFFCVPGIGGNLLRLADLADHIGPDQPFYCFQMPGLDGRQGPFSYIEEVAAYFNGILLGVEPSGPYYLGGYSWGGVVALEMAQQLQAQGKVVALLAIFDTTVQHPRYRYLKNIVEHLGNLLQVDDKRREDVFISIRDRLFDLDYRSRKKLGQFSITQAVSRLRSNTRSTSSANSNHSKTETNREEFDNWAKFEIHPRKAELMRSNSRSLKIYMPSTYEGQIHLFRSELGDNNPNFRSTDPKLGWGKVASRGVEIHNFPGDHLTMLHEPNVRILAEKLRDCLDRAKSYGQLTSPMLPRTECEPTAIPNARR